VVFFSRSKETTIEIKSKAKKTRTENEKALVGFSFLKFKLLQGGEIKTTVENEKKNQTKSTGV